MSSFIGSVIARLLKLALMNGWQHVRRCDRREVKRQVRVGRHGVHREWSKAEDAKLLRMWPNHTAEEIAEVLRDRTRNAILGRIHRLRRRKSSPHKNKHAERDRAMAHDYLEGGMMRREIAARYGVPHYTVANVFARDGVVLSTAERKARIQRNRAELAAKGVLGRKPYWPDCPPELKAAYDKLHYRYGFKRSEAKEMVLEGVG